MRTLAIVSLALFTIGAAYADAPSPPAPLKPTLPKIETPIPAALPTNVEQLRDEWMQCTAAAAKADLRSSRPAEAVADAALQRCKAQAQLEQLKRRPTDLVIVFVELFGARLTLGAEM